MIRAPVLPPRGRGDPAPPRPRRPRGQGTASAPRTPGLTAPAASGGAVVAVGPRRGAAGEEQIRSYIDLLWRGRPGRHKKSSRCSKNDSFPHHLPHFQKKSPCISTGGPFIMRRSRVMVIVTALGHSAAPFRSAFWGAHRPSKPNPLRKSDAPKPPIGQNNARSFRFRMRRAVLLI